VFLQDGIGELVRHGAGLSGCWGKVSTLLVAWWELGLTHDVGGLC
jgi:hypothetical protein